jgi:hypothetical protein
LAEVADEVFPVFFAAVAAVSVAATESGVVSRETDVVCLLFSVVLDDVERVERLFDPRFR